MTQKEMILKYIEMNGSITTLEAMRKLLILDPQKPIQLLRQEGYKIKDRYIVKRNIYGEKRAFKRYYLEKE